MDEALRRTPIFDDLVELGGRMVPFAGYEMPVQFEGVKAEHRAVRERAGLFDVSHMGEIWLEGPDALACADWLVTNDIAGLGDGQAAYTPMCRDDGGIVDDLLVYRLASDRILLVVNAACHDKDLEHVRASARGDVRVIDRSYETGQLALQGPAAADIMVEVSGPRWRDLEVFRFGEGEVAGRTCLVSRTGYTGEDGYEIYCPNFDLPHVFRSIMAAGEGRGIVPVGLGARDTLRLECRMMLYGNDIDLDTNPLEAGLSWTVKLDKEDFVGKAALVAIKERGARRRLAGFEMVDRGIARHGYAVVPAGAGPDAEPVGAVTSGSPSPTLGKNIGLAYLPRKGYKSGAELGVVIRGKVLAAKVVKTPFYKRAD